MIGISVEITLRENDTGDYIRVPVVPEKFSYTDGSKQAETVQIVNLGAVNIPTGVELDEITWDSFFPARYDASYCSHPDIHSPITYRNVFSTWKDDGTSLQIVCPAFGLNKTMYLSAFKWEPEGFEGDISYSVTFTELKTIIPKQLVVGTNADSPENKQAEDRPAAASNGKPATYTVQDGDTLTHIAKKLQLADWKSLYELNKDVIGGDPSQIYVGQVYKVP